MHTVLRQLRERVASLLGRETRQEDIVLNAADALDEMMADFEEEQGEEALKECLENNDSLGDVVEAMESNSSLSADDYPFPGNINENDTVEFDP